ncbi:hypothetical protein CHS0354_039035 [Potamilus streckersoni]|uniref:CDK5 regulatory subunit-associated protein 3 n=1 Tax=Potamilus streckersoni TaxID=2493646 RepID=A0AAE0RRT8_9BIVA|nr:hypothetical protein CHS0354_039035 [Potamilus streckersoni]
MAQQKQEMENLPIDIHYNKLLDWLLNRRHCNQNWQTVAHVIHEKINEALRDMPQTEELSKVLQGTSSLNYSHCKQILNLLESTESNKKNIFGQYTSQRMKDWSDIIKLYERDGVYLADTAQMLMRNVNYEIPALKKQMAKCQQVQKECDRKEAEYVSKAAELRKKYETSCKQIGIEGKKIKSELAALVKDLPSVFSKIAASTSSLQKAVDFYAGFTDFVTNSKSLGSESLPFLRFIQKHSNVTTYEWRTGSKPVSVVETSIVIDTKDEEDVNQSVNTDSIDWGDGGQTVDVNSSNDLDFDISGITLESGGTEEGKVDIDLSIEPLVEEIDWGGSGEATQVDVTSSESEEGVAQGEDALTILDNPRTRNSFLDDMYELESFLLQHVNELRGENDMVASSLFQTASNDLQLSREGVEVMLTLVKDIIEQLTSVKIQHLMLIRNSPRYVDRLKESLQQTLKHADKMVLYEKEMTMKSREAIEEEGQLHPKLDVLRQQTKEMQKQMEEEISKKYKGRRVNIMGEINTI